MEYHSLITPMNKKGFTLLELLLSMGIFLLIFTTLTQGFLLVSKITARLDVQREMTIYSSKLLTSINNDMDSFPLLVHERKDNAISLENKDTSSTVTYSLQSLTEEEKNTIEKRLPNTISNANDLSVLVRKENDKEYRYFHPSFVLSKASIHISPEKDQECSFSPLVSIDATVLYIPKNRSETLQMQELLHTSFSSPEEPSAYLNRSCSH